MLRCPFDCWVVATQVGHGGGRVSKAMQGKHCLDGQHWLGQAGRCHFQEHEPQACMRTATFVHAAGRSRARHWRARGAPRLMFKHIHSMTQDAPELGIGGPVVHHGITPPCKLLLMMVRQLTGAG